MIRRAINAVPSTTAAPASTSPATSPVAVPDPVAAIALLDEPRRRALYEYVTGRREPVGRDEAAKALGIGRELAAFHLDRLAAVGLLDVEYRRLGGRTGPGAGRPAKLYRRTDREAIVSLPGRDYERAAEVFAEALDQLNTSAVRSAVDQVAHARGVEAGAAARGKAGADAGPGQLRAGLVQVLGEAGYEPTSDSGSPTIRLQNCPFHAVVANHRDLTCGMNVAWAQGVLDGLGGTPAGIEPADSRRPPAGEAVDGTGGQGLEAVLAPEPGYCCVVFRGVTDQITDS